MMFKCPKCGKNLVAEVKKNGVGARGEYSKLPEPVTKYEYQGCGYQPKKKEVSKNLRTLSLPTLRVRKL